MSKQQATSLYMRVFHRYLGFFLVGIMAVYAISGVVLIFRETDYLKKEKQVEKQLEVNLQAHEVASKLKIKNFQVAKNEGEVMYFKEGTYNSSTGLASYTVKELPYVLGKMTHLHKATTKDPLYWLNIFFGGSLLFFVISSFWMFRPKTSVFQTGMYFTLAGIVLTLILLFV